MRDGTLSWVEIASGGPVTITKASILTSTTGLANTNFRAHVYTASPTVTNGNDGVLQSKASGHFCRLDVTVDQASRTEPTAPACPSRVRPASVLPLHRPSMCYSRPAGPMPGPPPQP